MTWDQRRNLPEYMCKAGPFVALVLIWTAAVLVVGPWGEYLANDDWAYIKSLDILLTEGRLADTGWAGGGLALITHLLWGGLFTTLFGFCTQTLHWSVLTLSLLGGLALLGLLLRLGVRRGPALLFTLFFLLNPLQFALSFTYMTDATFAAFCAAALFFVHEGRLRGGAMLTMIGLLFALAAILDRQFGLWLTVGFMAAVWFTCADAAGRLKMTVWALALTVAPWLMWEVWLAAAGSTPVTDHQLFFKIFDRVGRLGWFDYLLFLWSRFFVVGLGCTAFFVGPVLFWQIQPEWSRLWVRRLAYGYLVVWALFEALLLLGAVDLEAVFFPNVIIDFGIGPLLFKDTYILGLERSPGLSSAGYGLILGLAAPLTALLVARGYRTLKDLFHGRAPFMAVMALCGGGAYLGVIVVTGFHDRYLIPLLLAAIVWLAADRPRPDPAPIAFRGLAVGMFLAVLVFSVAGTHDYISLRRAAHTAQAHARLEMGLDPCRADLGFEYSGWFCYDPDYTPKGGLSWWWVREEKVLLTLGPLPGYEVERAFPFNRLMGPNGAVYMMRPEGEGDEAARKPESEV